MRITPKARQAKGKARLNAYDDLMREHQEQDSRSTNKIYIPPGERLGDLVVEATNLRKAFGERVLIDDLSFRPPRGGIVGIIGATKPASPPCSHARRRRNPDQGELKVGETVDIAYVTSLVTPSTATRPSGKISKAKATFGSVSVKLSRAYVASFNFNGSDHQKPVGALSGGERNRSPRQAAQTRRQLAASR